MQFIDIQPLASIEYYQKIRLYFVKTNESLPDFVSTAFQYYLGANDTWYS